MTGHTGKQVHDARVVANWFIDKALGEGKRLTIMELLKLVYIAHGWHLECTGRPLIRNRIEAWRYGPVIPDVYHAYRSRDAKNFDVAKVKFFLRRTTLDDEQVDLLENVYLTYRDIDGPMLSTLTHVDNGPWDIAYRCGGPFASIGDDLIRQHYQSIRKEIENGRGSVDS